MKTNRTGLLVAAASGLVAAAGLFGAHASAMPVEPAVVSGLTLDPPDQLVFKDGRVVQGEVLEETDSEVRFMVIVAGIKGEQVYSKSDILAIERGVGGEAEAVVSEEADVASATYDEDPLDGAPSVYVMELTGWFGRDITMTPIRDAVKDAAKHRPDYVILVMDNTWEINGRELPDDIGARFSEIFRAEDIEPIFTAELPQMLGYEPEIVVWVKTAMAGMSFLPFNFDKIYFSSEGRMGGIGNLIYQYGTTGDEMVREKLFSAGMGHAEGMAIRGGYDPRIIRAMARADYELSYRIESGRAVLVEGLPNTDLGEVLLTEDGTIQENQDTDRELARGLGNDTLTLNADVAEVLGISLGTVDDLDSLLYELEIDRNHRIIEGRSERIMDGWTDSLKGAERNLKRLWKELGEVQVGGERRERITARARQMRLIDQILQILNKYGEVDELGRLEKPEGMPGEPELRVWREQIRQEQMKDR